MPAWARTLADPLLPAAHPAGIVTRFRWVICGLLFLATTSRPDLLDEAFVRPGRFDLAIRLEPGGSCIIEQLALRAGA